MNKKSQILATAAFTGLLALAPAFAQNQGTTSGSTTGQGAQGKGQAKGQQSGQLSAQDRTFTMRAAEGSMMEIELGRLAAQKATNADVKAFAQRMVTDHGKASQRLMTIATQNKITPPATLPANLRAEMDKLTRLSGAEFDRMYMSHMLKHHRKDIADFEKQASKGDNDALQAFAQETLPTLRQHYQLAQTVGTKVGAPMDHSDHKPGKSGH
ncbi:MAG TPA: DUF4142 domain-containing protein [Thermoanaerobaculia bacterium]